MNNLEEMDAGIISPQPSDPCVCGHNRKEHTANRHCGKCKCEEFEQSDEKVFWDSEG
jgi:hypothetical protein